MSKYVRLEEFWQNQGKLKKGSRVSACGESGFIIEWDVDINSFVLEGTFAILYDNRIFERYDAFFLTYTFAVLDSDKRWMNLPEVVENAYKRYCENVFLGSLRDEFLESQRKID